MQSQKEIIVEMLYSRHFLSASEDQVNLFQLAVGCLKGQVSSLTIWGLFTFAKII